MIRPFAVLLAAEAEPVLNRLDPELRARVLMALLGLLLLGVALVLFVLMGGRFVRRMARHRVASTTPAADAWYRKPLPAPNQDDEP